VAAWAEGHSVLSNMFGSTEALPLATRTLIS